MLYGSPQLTQISRQILLSLVCPAIALLGACAEQRVGLMQEKMQGTWVEHHPEKEKRSKYQVEIQGNHIAISEIDALGYRTDVSCEYRLLPHPNQNLWRAFIFESLLLPSGEGIPCAVFFERQFLVFQPPGQALYFQRVQP
jgi:hypothetical protein